MVAHRGDGNTRRWPTSNICIYRERSYDINWERGRKKRIGRLKKNNCVYVFLFDALADTHDQPLSQAGADTSVHSSAAMCIVVWISEEMHAECLAARHDQSCIGMPNWQPRRQTLSAMNGYCLRCEIKLVCRTKEAKQGSPTWRS